MIKSIRNILKALVGICQNQKIFVRSKVDANKVPGEKDQIISAMSVREGR